MIVEEREGAGKFGGWLGQHTGHVEDKEVSPQP